MCISRERILQNVAIDSLRACEVVCVNLCAFQRWFIVSPNSQKHPSSLFQVLVQVHILQDPNPARQFGYFFLSSLPSSLPPSLPSFRLKKQVVTSQILPSALPFLEHMLSLPFARLPKFWIISLPVLHPFVIIFQRTVFQFSNLVNPLIPVVFNNVLD